MATANGRSETENITDNGKPFRITSDGEPNYAPGLSAWSGRVPFSSYTAVYAGGAANIQEQAVGPFIQVNPATYRGISSP